MSLRVSDAYAQILEKARWSHSHGRNISHIHATDVEQARLFSYGFRTQTIGAFHATRVRLEARAQEPTPTGAQNCLLQASDFLHELEAKAVDPICSDHRALVSTLHFYDQKIAELDELLMQACAHDAHPHVQTIHNLFLRNMERVTAGNGIYIAQDLQLPEQGAFIVPDLDISIAPLIYGDYHSWNAAFLAADKPGVAVHRHRSGAEIHLGYSPLKGSTILGDRFAEVEESYAMPIPPMTDHGFWNTSGEDHVLPFVFGSLKAGGWGVFFDVEARPADPHNRKSAPLESEQMNCSVPLERAIQRMKSGSGFAREVLVPAGRAGSREIGSLELAVTGGQDPIEIHSHHYRIISVQSGRARIQIGNAQAEVGEHDHFGIPAEMDCLLTPRTVEPFVFLDAAILPLAKAKTSQADMFIGSHFA